jgi:cytochrome c-type biogenesis protein CcmH
MTVHAHAPHGRRRVASGLRTLCLLLACMTSAGAWSRDARPASDDPATEARMLQLTSEMRCLVCQNQTIADSHAELAEDLRQEVRELLRKGQSDQQSIDYMTARYGDFVLYRPPLRGRTLLLWYGPAAMLLGGFGALALLLRRRARLGDEHYEPDIAESLEAETSP